MNLEVFYTDPPNKSGDNSPRQENLPITNSVTVVTWSGSVDQAARKAEFSIAYNTPNKDKSFMPVDVKLGGSVDIYYSDETQTRVQIFSGRVFFRKRNTTQFSYDIVAYDEMIYLAKNKIQKKFSDVTVTDAIKQICVEAGVECGEIPNLTSKFNYIADGKTCPEVLKKLSETNVASGGKALTAYCNLGKVMVVEKGSNVIEGYIASDSINVDHTEHSESIENMVNKVVSVDKAGNIVQTYQNDEEVTKFGQLQDVYKVRPAKKGETVDNAAEAKAKLKSIESNSSLEGLGNVQCITGYTITIQEEQLQGNFFIKSDTHKFANNIHTMTLSLEYMEEEGNA